MRLVEKVTCPACSGIVLGLVDFTDGPDPVPSGLTCPDCRHQWQSDHQIGLGRGHLIKD